MVSYVFKKVFLSLSVWCLINKRVFYEKERTKMCTQNLDAL